METVHQCEHYQRNCIYSIIQAMSNHPAAKHSSHANSATMSSMNTRRDVRSIACSSIKSSRSNVLTV